MPVSLYTRKKLRFPEKARRVPKDQQYLWTQDWQKAMHEAEKDVAAGRVSGPFATAGDAIAALRQK